MTDLVERLRQYQNHPSFNSGQDLAEEAADEIERLTDLADAQARFKRQYRRELSDLEAENERLRAVYEAAKKVPYVQGVPGMVELEKALAAVEDKE